MRRANLNKACYLLDLNALIALVDPDSPHYGAIQKWFDSEGKRDWGVCTLTEAGFIRVTTNPAYRGSSRSVAQATTVLHELSVQPGYRYWMINDKWADVTAPFAARVAGHQQVTDAYLLGLAIKEKGVLVTFDKAIKYLAGSDYSSNLLVLE
jgi:toxin-antitoxin system PIN domain toxin